MTTTLELLIARSDLDLGYPVYPEDELGREHHGCPVWGVGRVVAEESGEWSPQWTITGLTLAEAREVGDRLPSRILS
jgi:hypothetical protein